MTLYILASIGVLAVLVICLVLVVGLLGGWMAQPVSYTARPEDVQRYLKSWGAAIADGGRIEVRHSASGGLVTFVKRRRKKTGDALLLKVRDSDSERLRLRHVELAFAADGIGFNLERTPAGRPRAISVPFQLGSDPVSMSAAGHAARVALNAMGAPDEGPYELTCHASHRPDYVHGSVDVIPWTRGYRLGFVVGQVMSRVTGRS